MTDPARAQFRVIHLNPPECDCCICGERCIVAQGVPIYEDEIVPDDYQGEWGGQSVCRRCYYVVRGIQSEQPGRIILKAQVRALLQPEFTQ